MTLQLTLTAAAQHAHRAADHTTHEPTWIPWYVVAACMLVAASVVLGIWQDYYEEDHD